MKTTMRFEGGRELASKLSTLSKRIDKRVTREALEVGAEPLRASASRMAPRRAPQPDMADHIIISPARTRSGETAAVKVGPADEFYWGFFQELGTVHVPAQPFLRPAFDQNWQKVLDIVRDAFWTALAAVGVSRSVSIPSEPEAPGGGDVV